MASKDEKDRYDGLTGGTDVPVSDERFSLEEILAEYGAGREQRLMEAVEQEARREASPAAPPPEWNAVSPLCPYAPSLVQINLMHPMLRRAGIFPR